MQHPNDRGLDTYTYMYVYVQTYVFINMGFPGGSEVKVSAMHLCTSRE